MIRFLALGLATLLLANCATGARQPVETLTAVPVSSKLATSFLSPASNNLAPQQQYRVGPLDTLEVSVFLAPELARTVQVDGAGQISLPLIGSLTASGLTSQQVSDEIAARLKGRFILEPQVTVLVKEAILQRITIDGAVEEPGVFPIAGRTTLLQGVAMAKGVHPVADLKNVMVLRTVNGRSMAARFDLAAIRSGKEPDPELYANDIVVVDTSRARRIVRDFAPLTPLISVFRVFVPY